MYGVRLLQFRMSGKKTAETSNRFDEKNRSGEPEKKIDKEERKER